MCVCVCEHGGGGWSQQRSPLEPCRNPPLSNPSHQQQTFVPADGGSSQSPASSSDPRSSDITETTWRVSRRQSQDLQSQSLVPLVSIPVGHSWSSVRAHGWSLRLDSVSPPVPTEAAASFLGVLNTSCHPPRKQSRKKDPDCLHLEPDLVDQLRAEVCENRSCVTSRRKVFRSIKETKLFSRKGK